MKDKELLSRLCGKIRIVAVPAEELVEIDERISLREKGVLKYISGKSEFIIRGYFNGVDMAMMIHTECGKKPGMRVASGTNGCIHKKVTYLGDKGLDAKNAINGNNPLYAAQTALSAINALRETFDYKYLARHYAIIKEGGEGMVHMPSKVIVEANVRAADFLKLKEMNERINRAYMAGALAVGAQVEIDDLMFYVPETDRKSPELMQIAYEVGCELLGKENVRVNFNEVDGNIGATDLGNIGAVIPVIQPFSTGAVGVTHQQTYEIKYPEYAVFNPACIQSAIACVLLEKEGERAKKIISDYEPIYSSFEEYCIEMDKIYQTKKIEYNDEGEATVTWR